jgi:biopolymer transport protein ExbB
MTAVKMLQQVMVEAGAQWVLWVLAVLSVLSVAVIIERWIFYRSCGLELRPLAEKLDGWLRRGERQAALEALSQLKAPAAQVAAAGLKLADRGPAAADKAMQAALALERGRLQQWLAYLGTLGNNAPFIGLFGTVIGVIHAFAEMGHATPGHPGVTSHVASEAIMSGISEALVSTAIGLLVALPAVAAYNYFQRRVDGLLSGTEALSNLVLAYLSEKE